MLNPLQRAVAWAAQAMGATPPTDPMDPRLWGLGSQIATAGQLVTPDTAQQLDVVQSVLERLGGSISTLPLMVFERVGPNGEDRREARDHPLFKILHSRPNARQTAQEFRDELERHLAGWRNAYALIVPGADGYPIGQLIPTHPDRVLKVERGTDGWVYYTVRRLPPAAGNDVYRDDEIFHLRRAPLTINGLQGRSVWETSRETLGRALAVEEFASLYFANGGAGGGVLEHPGKFATKEDQQAFLETWRSGGTGRNRHKDRLALFGIKYTRDPLTNDDAQFIETKKEMGVSVCRLWNMPPHMVGLMDKATFSNIEQQSIEYVVHTLQPHVAAWEQGCARDLLVGEEQDRFFVEFNVSGLLRGDFKTRWAGYAQGRQWGWLSVNDIRRMEGLDPLDQGGDTYLTPTNMVPAGTQPGDGGRDDDPQDPTEIEEND